MRPVPVPWVLRIHSRPYRGSMQCQLHAINKQVEIRPILTIMKPRVMHHLADDLLDPTPYAVKHPVVPSLERQTTTRAVALCTSRQVPVEDTTELVLLVFYQAESRCKRVNSTYNSMLMQSHCQCTLPVRTAKFTCNSMLMQSHCQFTIPVRTATVRWVTEVQLASLPAFVKDLGI